MYSVHACVGGGGENGKYKVRGKMRENGRVCMGEVTEKGQSYRERMTEELARDRMTDRVTEKGWR